MDGLLFYADLYASWVESLSVMWDALNSNIYDFAVRASAGGTNMAWTPIAIFLHNNGFQDVSVLGFILSMMGAGFVIYFGVMLTKWITGIIT